MSTTAHPLEPPTLLRLLAHEIRWQVVGALARSDYQVNELVTLLQKPINLLSYHLRLLRNEAIVQERRSSADARDVYYTLNFEQVQSLYQFALGSLHPALGAPAAEGIVQQDAPPRPPARVLFLCTHNSARSQIAEALLRHLGGDRVEVYSAGTQPSTVHPLALAVLQRNEIDTTGLTSKHLEQFIGQQFDFVITVCDRAKESCPIFPGDPERIHWSFPDPSAVADPDEQYRAFVQVLVELEKRLKLLLTLIDRERRNA
jgi:ArsR family transcriptional regulator, arsenate/arsenite/antimonite-responsive transcriptional repressor / arsenate reductase (thioredoxin)